MKNVDAFLLDNSGKTKYLAFILYLEYLKRKIRIKILKHKPVALAEIIIMSLRCIPYESHRVSPKIKSIYITGETSSSLFVRIALII